MKWTRFPERAWEPTGTRIVTDPITKEVREVNTYSSSPVTPEDASRRRDVAQTLGAMEV